MKIRLFLIASYLILAYGAVMASKPIVVVLSMDAFRWDYPSMYNTPTLDSLKRAGSSAITYPCFPANTFPNHYSMATGLHPDHHGIVNNGFYDKLQDRTFSMKDSASIADRQFWRGEPIWVTAEKQGVKSSTFFWVGSETNGHKASVWKPFDSQVPFGARADSIISWLSLPEAQMPRLIMWYVEEPDAIAHKYGPESPQTRQQVESLDSLLGVFFAKVKQIDSYDRINFIVTSDHGMASLAPDRYINIYNKLDNKRIRSVSGGSPLQIDTDPDYLDEAYNQLKGTPNLMVWRREDVPNRYHYGSDTTRIERLLVQPKTGYKVDYRTTDRPPLTGAASHGFDPFDKEMQTIFYATGPKFKVNYEAKSFQNLNLYELIAKLLEIDPAPNDGNLKNVKQMLRK